MRFLCWVFGCFPINKSALYSSAGAALMTSRDMDATSEKKIDRVVKKVLRLVDGGPALLVASLDGSSKLDYLMEAVDLLERRVVYSKPDGQLKREINKSRASQLEKRVKTLSEVLESTNKKLTEEIISKKRAEDDLKKKQEKFREIIENASDIIYTSDSEGYFTYINKACKKLTGYPREHFIGRHFTEIILPEWREKVATFYNSQFRDRIRKTLYSFPIKTRSGKIRWVEQTVLQITENGLISEYQAIVRDITERKVASDKLREYAREIADLNRTLKRNVKELEKTNSELKSFSYTVSHDLRTPLRAINSYASILIDEYSDTLDKKGKEMLQTVVGNAVKMGQLIDQLLAFSSLGRKELLKRPVSVKEVVQDVLYDLKRLKSQKPVKIIVQRLPSAVCDYDLIKQVFVNLVSNAIKFSANCPNPKILIGSHKEGKQVVYFVKDNGIGFDMKYINKLFGVFQKLHQVEEYEGTGAGLAIVKRIVEKHGGEIWAEAKKDKGATFYFTLSKGE